MDSKGIKFECTKDCKKKNTSECFELNCIEGQNDILQQLSQQVKECEKYKARSESLQDIADGLQKRNHLLTLDNERLEQECEELKKYIQEREVWGDHCEFCKHNDKENCHQNIILDNLKMINRYRNALEEIEYICKNGAYNEFKIPLDECSIILKIISKIKEEEI